MGWNVLSGRRLAQIGLLMAAFACARPGAAQTTIHAIGGAVTGYDTNIMAASEHPLPGMPSRRRDGLLQLQAGLALLSDSPRYAQSIDYLHSATFYFEHDDARAGSDRLSWTGVYLLSRRSELTVSAEIARGKHHLASLLRPASATAVTARPTGPVQFVSSVVGAGYRYDLTPVWTFTDGAHLRWYTPIATGTRTVRTDVGNIIGVERVWARDAVALGARTDYFVSVSDDSAPSQQQVILGMNAQWRRDLSMKWSSSLEAGFASAAKADDLGTTTASPTGRASLAYTTEDGRADIYVQRTVEPNLLVNLNFITDAAGIRGAVPIVSSAGLVVSATAGYAHSRRVPITPTALRADADLLVADVALGWAPVPGLVVEARYQRIEQMSDNLPGGPPDYSRDVALLTIRGMFPNRSVGGLLASYADRVDRTDPRRARSRYGAGIPANIRGGGSSAPMERR